MPPARLNRAKPPVVVRARLKLRPAPPARKAPRAKIPLRYTVQRHKTNEPELRRIYEVLGPERRSWPHKGKTVMPTADMVAPAVVAEEIVVEQKRVHKRAPKRALVSLAPKAMKVVVVKEKPVVRKGPARPHKPAPKRALVTKKPVTKGAPKRALGAAARNDVTALLVPITTSPPSSPDTALKDAGFVSASDDDDSSDDKKDDWGTPSPRVAVISTVPLRPAMYPPGDARGSAGERRNYDGGRLPVEPRPLTPPGYHLTDAQKRRLAADIKKAEEEEIRASYGNTKWYASGKGKARMDPLDNAYGPGSL
jgi:hypothetical protein